MVTISFLKTIIDSLKFSNYTCVSLDIIYFSRNITVFCRSSCFIKRTLLYLNLFLIFPSVHVWVWVCVCICGFFCVCQFILTRDLSILLIFFKNYGLLFICLSFFSYFYSLLLLSCFFVFVNILFLPSIIKNR